ncbi:MAG: preprotein translocase subunit SecD [Firmicutes bacterium GWF2_51_9]|nr:MAG: preprotein translocase subunit SecD [Firmicutes bacterium GWF2_51_9]OGS58068.1 MAG: preprotein translocase subunit SecD [Firmicutes bacterium GWE2_51_13]HAO60639.1 protein translocase subunit SecDF [Erysipelotrichaceae bacterium]HBZ41290.1 protein translocase subunit SecDF [Erysipelotrichaceae bacterium]
MKKNSRIFVFIATIIALFALILAFAGDIRKNMTLGLDLQGGFEIVYEVTPLEDGGDLPALSAVARSVSKRIDILGVNEPEIIIEGNNRIRVQLAGVNDQEQARRIISATANLEFRDVDDKLLADASILEEGGASLGYENGFIVVSLKIKDQDKFYEITKEVATRSNGKNMIVTWLDFEEGVDSYDAEAEKVEKGETPKYVSAATVSEGINGDAIIKGSFTENEAREMADLINSGSLPVKMTELYSNVVSAQYGANAFSQTMFAGILGVIGVALFMMLVYRLPGIISAIMLMLYVFFVMLVYNTMGGVFTLPGIAALVLGVGMTVDANVITFERIKDELYLGRSVRKAFEEGHQLAWWTIFDSQFTIFISAVIMYMFGTGAVKGFATMLMVTIFGTLLINVFFVKFLLGLLVKSTLLDKKPTWFAVRAKDLPDISKGEEPRYHGIFSKVDFVGVSKYFITASIVVLVGGLLVGGFNFVKGDDFMNLGIDFTSGTKITVLSDTVLDEATLKADFAELGIENFQLQFSGDKIANITTKEVLTRPVLEEISDAMLEKYGYASNDSVVTPIVGGELVRSAFILSVLAWILMLAYIAFRFELDYAVGMIVALVHDVLIVLAVFSIFRLEVNTELVSVILAIIGYSADDTIVIFDRIRENINAWTKPHISHKDYRNLVNDSLRTVAQRSLYNTITTLIPILFLLALGSGAIFTFNFAMLVGLISGAYSSIFIAAQFWYFMRINKKNPTKNKVVKARRKEDLDEMTIIGIND